MAQRVRRWAPAARPIARVELWLTPDIVALPPPRPSRCFALVTSTNERLEPPSFTTSEAAAAFPGTNVIYPEQIVDGRVHELGGAQLAASLAAFPALDDGGTRCFAGGAVLTPLRSHTASPLSQSFEHIVHAVAPSHGAPDWAASLGRCYGSALDLVWRSAAAAPQPASLITVVLPLLGAGAKAVPVAAAARIAAESCGCWRPPCDSSSSSDSRPEMELELLFGVQEDEVAGVTEDEFERQSAWQ